MIHNLLWYCKEFLKFHESSECANNPCRNPNTEFPTKYVNKNYPNFQKQTMSFLPAVQFAKLIIIFAEIFRMSFVGAYCY